MRAINNLTQFENRRMLNIKEAAGYIGVGENKARTWLKEVGALRKIGARALYDRQIIDASLDNMKGA